MASTKSHTLVFTNFTYTMFNSQMKQIWQFWIYKNGNFIGLNLIDRARYISEIWESGSLSSINLPRVGFLGGKKSHMERAKLLHWEKIVICVCKSHLVLAGRETVWTAADVISMPFISRAKASLIQFTQSCDVQAFELLMTQHWLSPSSCFSLYSREKGWQEVKLLLPPK